MPNVPLFRHVQLRLGRVALGEPLPESVLAASGSLPNATEIKLPAGSFGKAQTITLRRTPSGLLRSAEFTYPPDADLEKMIGEYVSLGDPTRETAKSGERIIDLARWSDADTELILTRETDAAGTRIRGELRDQRTS